MWPLGSVAMCPGVTLLMRKCRIDAKVPVRGAPRERVRFMLGHDQHYGLGRGIGDNGVRLTELQRDRW
jgi:hypothetical protein